MTFLFEFDPSYLKGHLLWSIKMLQMNWNFDLIISFNNHFVKLHSHWPIVKKLDLRSSKCLLYSQKNGCSKSLNRQTPPTPMTSLGGRGGQHDKQCKRGGLQFATQSWHDIKLMSASCHANLIPWYQQQDIMLTLWWSLNNRVLNLALMPSLQKNRGQKESLT